VPIGIDQIAVMSEPKSNNGQNRGRLRFHDSTTAFRRKAKGNKQIYPFSRKEKHERNSKIQLFKPMSKWWL